MGHGDQDAISHLPNAHASSLVSVDSDFDEPDDHEQTSIMQYDGVPIQSGRNMRGTLWTQIIKTSNCTPENHVRWKCRNAQMLQRQYMHICTPFAYLSRTSSGKLAAYSPQPTRF